MFDAASFLEHFKTMTFSEACGGLCNVGQVDQTGVPMDYDAFYDTVNSSEGREQLE